MQQDKRKKRKRKPDPGRMPATQQRCEKTVASDHIDSSARPGGAAVGTRPWLFRAETVLWLLLAVIFTFGTWLRFQGALWDEVELPDSGQYLAFADDIRHLRFLRSGYALEDSIGIHRTLPPLYPSLVALASVIPANLENIGIAVSLAMSVLTLILVFLLARYLYNAAAGLISAALFCACPFVLDFASVALTEATFTFFFTASCAAGLVAIESKRAWAFALAGALCALTFLTREPGICTIGLLTLATVICYLWIDRQPLKKAVFPAALMLGVFVAVCIPNVVYVKAYTGYLGISGRYTNEGILRLIDETGEREQTPAEPVVGAAETETANMPDSPRASSVLSRVTNVAARVGRMTWEYVKEFLVHMGVLPVALTVAAWIWSGIHAYRYRSRRLVFRELFLVAWMLQLALTYGLVQERIYFRYTYPLTGCLLVVAGLGVARIGESLARFLQRRIARRTARAALPLWGTVVVAAAVIGVYYYQAEDEIERIYDRTQWGTRHLALSAGYRRMADDFFARHSEYRRSTMVTRDPVGAYYLDVNRTVRMPDTAEQLHVVDAELLLMNSFVVRFTPGFWISLTAIIRRCRAKSYTVACFRTVGESSHCTIWRTRAQPIRCPLQA